MHFTARPPPSTRAPDMGGGGFNSDTREQNTPETPSARNTPPQSRRDCPCLTPPFPPPLAMH